MSANAPGPDATRLRELARSLPYEEPTEARMAELGRAVSLAAPVRSGAMGRMALAGAVLAGAAAAALVAMVLAPAASTPHPLRGRVSPEAGARFQHLASPAASLPEWTEVVLLEEGAAWFDVERLEPGESFRVLAGDGVVEVKGTRFRCDVEGGKLISVEVERGRVELRLAGAAPLALGPGERWSPPASGTRAPVIAPDITAPRPAHRRVARAAAPSPPSDPPPAPDPASPPEPVRPEPPPPPQLRPEERAFAEGWNALRDGDASSAAARFATIPPADPLGEDAAYWSLVARARLGSVPPDDLRSFLDRFPTSSRRGEVNLMLGLRLLGSGDEAGARLSLRAAARDPSPRVARAAREALDSLSPSAVPVAP